MEQPIVIVRHDAHVKLYRDWFECDYRRGAALRVVNTLGAGDLGVLVFHHAEPCYQRRVQMMRAHYWAWMRAPGFCGLTLVPKT